ncbi:hypothetical protein QBC46DRAFT_240792, partial [Diplogelasinospora grovesii]
VAEVQEHGGSSRKDANHVRFNAFREKQIEAGKKYFDPIVPAPERLHLQILSTLPDHRRAGYGSALCNWAMNLVREEGLKGMSVMASPMGCELYTRLGFVRVGSVHIHIEGDDESVNLEAMIYWNP